MLIVNLDSVACFLPFFCIYTFGIRRSIDVLDQDKSAWIRIQGLRASKQKRKLLKLS